MTGFSFKKIFWLERGKHPSHSSPTEIQYTLFFIYLTSTATRTITRINKKKSFFATLLFHANFLLLQFVHFISRNVECYKFVRSYLQQEIRSVEHGICPIAEFTSP